VLATQNPIEQEGTYPLPEAQVDRFMLKLKVTYPSPEEERQILELVTGAPWPALKPVVTPADILRAREAVASVYVDEKIKSYVIDIVFATREPERFGLDLRPLIAYGASPRATIYLAQAAKAHAFLRGRGYVTPEDVKAIALDVLRHRVIVTYEAEAEEVTAEDIARRVLDRIEVP
jgi:MoxR-like ATPase